MKKNNLKTKCMMQKLSKVMKQTMNKSGAKCESKLVIQVHDYKHTNVYMEVRTDTCAYLPPSWSSP